MEAPYPLSAPIRPGLLKSTFSRRFVDFLNAVGGARRLARPPADGSGQAAPSRALHHSRPPAPPTARSTCPPWVARTAGDDLAQGQERPSPAGSIDRRSPGVFRGSTGSGTHFVPAENRRPRRGHPTCPEVVRRFFGVYPETSGPHVPVRPHASCAVQRPFLDACNPALSGATHRRFFRRYARRLTGNFPGNRRNFRGSDLRLFAITPCLQQQALTPCSRCPTRA